MLFDQQLDFLEESVVVLDRMVQSEAAMVLVQQLTCHWSRQWLLPHVSTQQQKAAPRWKLKEHGAIGMVMVPLQRSL